MGLTPHLRIALAAAHLLAFICRFISFPRRPVGGPGRVTCARDQKAPISRLTPCGAEPGSSSRLTMMPASGASNANFPFAVPQISHDELAIFHQSHFSNGAIIDFGQTFMNPAAAIESHNESHNDTNFDEWEEEEDDLGYYEDGVKRTLTDEQIEIFRHSELRELRKQQEKSKNAKTSANDATDNPQSLQETDLPPGFRSKKKKKKKPVKKEPKPDLRKRTWDVVEAGLDSLDYD